MIFEKQVFLNARVFQSNYLTKEISNQISRLYEEAYVKGTIEVSTSRKN